MTERNTPETDAVCHETYAQGVAHIPLVGFMEKLERERDKAKYQADFFLEKLREFQERCINAERESLEQSRLLGMSGEREAKLLAQLAVERALADRLAKILDLYYADDDIVPNAGIADALEAWKEARND